MKKTYEKLLFNINLYAVEDVLTTSDNFIDDQWDDTQAFQSSFTQ